MDAHNCRHLLGELSAYIDGEASEVLCAEIREHLAGCADCRAMVDTLRKTVTIYHTLPQVDLPAATRERLFRTLDLEDFLK